MRFFDPDQHLIEVGEPVPVLVKNLSERGLNPKEIAEKTGIPLEVVEKLLL